MAANIYDTKFNDDTGSGHSQNVFPEGWVKDEGGNVLLYGSTYTDATSATSTRGWLSDYYRTPSNNTGPGGGIVDDTGTSVTSGVWSSSSSYRFLFLEASIPASSSSYVRRHCLTMPELDLTGWSDVTLIFWFHAYGGYVGRMGNLGIACTTDQEDASAAQQAGDSLGFENDSDGGALIRWWEDYEGSSTDVGVRLGGDGHQETGHTTGLASSNYWRKATVDLSDADGVPSAYIHFAFFTKAIGTSWASDFAIDNLYIIGNYSSVKPNATFFGTNF